LLIRAIHFVWIQDVIQNSPVSLGTVTGRTGTRNTPSAAYSAFAPGFHFDAEEELYIGGQFLDGRAANLKEQAKAPFLNPDEVTTGTRLSWGVKTGWYQRIVVYLLLF
jgi:cytochrome c peroxidase